MEKEILRLLVTYKKKLSSLSDFYVNSGIPDKKKEKAIKNHNLKYGEKILFHSVHSLLGYVFNSTVMTNKVFSLKREGGEYMCLNWTDIEKVIFHGKSFHFVLDSDNNQNCVFSEDDVLPSYDKDQLSCTIFAQLLTEIACLFENEEQKNYKEIAQIHKNNHPISVIEKSKNFLNKYGEEANYSQKVHLLAARSYLQIGEVEKANQEILFCEEHIEGIDLLDDNGIEVAETKGDILLKNNKEYEALSFYRRALEYSADKAKINELKQKSESANNLLQVNFLEKPYQNRKLILVDDQQADLSSKHFKVLLKNNLPTLKFPIGHPIDKELYVGHPYNADVYIPLSIFEESIFMDRFQEFSYFLQSLGATKISIVNKRGAELGEAGEVSGKTKVKINALVAESNTTNEFSTTRESQSQNFKHISRTQTFSPVKKPFLPQNLVWYPHETSWQRLYEQRINGNILNHSEIISTEQNQVITRNEKRSIQQALEYYLVEAEASHSIDADHMFREKETTEWMINVEFAPIESLQGETGPSENQFPDTNSELVPPLVEKNQRKSIVQEETKNGEEVEGLIKLTADEKKYKTRVEILIEDRDEVTNEDRRILERVARKLNISTLKAKELEAQVLKNSSVYSEEDLRYIEEFNFFLEDDGEISEKERQILEQERIELSLSSERALELEEEIMSKFRRV